MKKLLLILALLAYVAISCEDKPNTLTGGDEPETEQPGTTPSDSTESPSEPGNPEEPSNPEDTTPKASFFAYIDMITPVPLGFNDPVHPNMPQYGYIWIVDDSTAHYIRETNLSSFEMLFRDDTVAYTYNPNDLIALFSNGSLTSIKEIRHNAGWFDSVAYGNYWLIAAIGIPHNDTIKTFTGSCHGLVIDESTHNDTIDIGNVGYLSPYWLTIGGFN